MPSVRSSRAVALPSPAPPEQAEVKVNIPARKVTKAMKALGLAAAEGKPRTIAFYDTPKRTLQARGLVLRAREKGGEGASTVKIRPVEPERIKAQLAADPGYKLELEVGAAESRRTLSASIDADLEEGKFAAVVEDGGKPKSLFNENQRALAEDLAGPVKWSGLRLFGPIPASTWKVELGDKKADAELWKLPGGQRMLELSIKCPLDEVEGVRASLLGLLAGHGLAAAKSTQSKTERALIAFSGDQT